MKRLLLPLLLLPLLGCQASYDSSTSAPATATSTPFESTRGQLVLVVDATGKQVTLPASGELTIGRAKSSDIYIPQGEVSRNHATLHKANTGYVLRDLHSVNGTHVNGARVSEAWLNDGDTITIGKAELLVSIPK